MGIKNTCCNEVMTGHPLHVVVAEPTGDSKTTSIISMSTQEKARIVAQIQLVGEAAACPKCATFKGHLAEMILDASVVLATLQLAKWHPD